MGGGTEMGRVAGFEEIRLRFNEDGCTRLPVGNTLSRTYNYLTGTKGLRAVTLANITSTSTICCSHHWSHRLSYTHVIGIGA